MEDLIRHLLSAVVVLDHTCSWNIFDMTGCSMLCYVHVCQVTKHLMFVHSDGERVEPQQLFSKKQLCM